MEIKNAIDSRKYNSELTLPMVIRKRKINQLTKFTGFVPGIYEQDVVEDTLEKCRELLFERTKARVKEMIKENSPFPFFPTKEEILQDFDDVVSITFVKVPTQK